MSIRTGRRAVIEPPKEPRPKCEKVGYCMERDAEGRCMDPQRGCEYNEYERLLLRVRLRDSRERAQRAIDEVNERLKGVVEGKSPGEEKGA